MDEIKELDNKYLVLKWDDIKKQDIEDEDDINRICEQIRDERRAEGKEPHLRYLVLNLDDEIDFTDLVSNWELSGMIRTAASKDDGLTLKVKDIAVDLVNAILKTKQERD